MWGATEENKENKLLLESSSGTSRIFSSYPNPLRGSHVGQIAF